MIWCFYCDVSQQSWVEGLIHHAKEIACVSRQTKSHDMKCTDGVNPGWECQVRESFRRYFDIYRDNRGLLTNCARKSGSWCESERTNIDGRVSQAQVLVYLWATKMRFWLHEEDIMCSLQLTRVCLILNWFECKQVSELFLEMYESVGLAGKTRLNKKPFHGKFQTLEVPV